MKTESQQHPLHLGYDLNKTRCVCETPSSLDVQDSKLTKLKVKSPKVLDPRHTHTKYEQGNLSRVTSKVKDYKRAYMHIDNPWV